MLAIHTSIHHAQVTARSVLPSGCLTIRGEDADTDCAIVLFVEARDVERLCREMTEARDQLRAASAIGE